MELQQVIQDTAKAVKGFRGDVDAIKRETTEQADRLKALEQLMADGGRLRAPGGETLAPLAKAIEDSDDVRAFVKGERKSAIVQVPTLLQRKNTITGDAGSPATPSDTLVEGTRLPGIVPGAFRALRVRELLTTLPTTSNRVEITREAAFANNADRQAEEGDAKAESDLSFELIEADVHTIAHFLRASRQSLEDQPALGAYIADRLSHGVEQKLETQLLVGTGSGGQMTGLVTGATAFTGASTGQSMLDDLRRAIAQVQVAEYAPTGVVLHPNDWDEIVRLKDNEDRYLFADPAAMTPPVLWGLPVVATASMTEGSFLLGDFGTAAILWDRQRATVEMSEDDLDNFTRNLVTVRGELRAALTITVPAAIVSGSFSA